MTRDTSRTPALPVSIYALFAVRLVVSAGSFVGPFLAMMLTLKLGYNETAAGAFMSAVSLVSALGLVVGGKLGDSFDRAIVLRNLQLITAAALLACAAVGFTALTPFLIALALGTLSGSWPVINALVADKAPPDRRKEAFSLLYWGNNIGFSVGPLVAGFLFDTAPRGLFLGNAGALIVAAIVVSVFVSRDPVASKSTIREALPPDLTAVARAPAETAQGSLDGKTGQGSLWTVLAANPVLVLYGLSSILVAFVYNQHTFALPIYLKDILGPVAGPKGYGMAMTVNGLTVVVFTVFVTYLSKRMPSLTAVALGAVFYAVGFGGYRFATGLPLVLVMTSVWTLGEILGATNGNAFIAERAPPAYRSRINSAISFCYIIGNALGPMAAGPIARAYGSAAVWPVVAVVSLAAAALTLGIHRFDKRRGSSVAVPSC
ncbi:MAG: MFS transporter [Spirochaetales bacterium]|nr:MAG: MFS transporter [Spirochaetales bacterium]